MALLPEEGRIHSLCALRWKFKHRGIESLASIKIIANYDHLTMDKCQKELEITRFRLVPDLSGAPAAHARQSSW
jgi:hypothetical protein